MTERDETSHLYNLWCAIGALSATLERRCWVDWEVRYYPNLFICLIGEPAVHKGTALRHARRLIRSLCLNLAPNACSTELLIHRMSEMEEYFENSETGEYTRHASIAVFAPELTVFTKVKESYHMALLCDLYDCHDYFEYTTLGRGEEIITNACVNLLGATTPESLRQHLPPESIGGGFGSRVIFVFADKNSEKLKSHIPTADQRAQEHRIYEELVDYLRGIKRLVGAFVVTPEVEEAYVEWRERSRTSPPTPAYDPNLLHYMGRRCAHMRKLMMAISAGRSHEMVLRYQDFAYAREILEMTENLMPRALRDVAKTDNQSILLGVLTRVYQMSPTGFSPNAQGLSFTDIMRELVGIVSVVDLKSLLDASVDVGYLRLVGTKENQRYIIGSNPRKGLI